MAVIRQPLMTVEEFARLPERADGSRLELVRGEVVTMPPAKGKHGVCCGKVSRLLGNHADAGKLGWVTTNDTGVLLERGPDTVRGPDVAFWSITRQPTIPEDYFEIPPDLAVEVLSPDDRRAAVRAKIKEYLFYSVKLIWLIDPEARTVIVYPGRMRGIELDEEDEIDGGDVLPGFSCKVSDLFA
ncbi:MAG: Uma2 family endonuclease [Gemmataceae bacterium]